MMFSDNYTPKLNNWNPTKRPLMGDVNKVAAFRHCSIFHLEHWLNIMYVGLYIIHTVTQTDVGNWMSKESERWHKEQECVVMPERGLSEAVRMSLRIWRWYMSLISFTTFANTSNLLKVHVCQTFVQPVPLRVCEYRFLCMASVNILKSDMQAISLSSISCTAFW